MRFALNPTVQIFGKILYFSWFLHDCLHLCHVFKALFKFTWEDLTDAASYIKYEKVKQSLHQYLFKYTISVWEELIQELNSWINAKLLFLGTDILNALLIIKKLLNLIQQKHNAYSSCKAYSFLLLTITQCSRNDSK